MGIVNISDLLHENLRVASGALSRSINAQAEHWMRIGMLAELHPDLCHGELCQMIVRNRMEGGDDQALFTLGAAPAKAPARAAARKAVR